MESTKSNRLIFGLFAGAALTGVGIYYLYTKSLSRKSSLSKKKPDHSSANTNPHTQAFLKDKAYLDMIQRLKSIIDSEKQTGSFSKVSLASIQRAILHLFKSEYLANYQENRSLRRKYLSSLVDYAAELFKGAAASEKLMEEATSEVLRDLQVDPVMYYREYDRVGHDDANFQLFNIYLLESLKTQIPAKQPNKLTKETLMEYFRFQLEIYNEVNIQELKDYSPDNLIICKQTFLGDKAAMKFGIEEEDIIREPIFLNDPSIVDLQRELQNRFFTEKQNSISFPY